MSRILITGATGNVGLEVLAFLNSMDTANKIVVGVRNIEKSKAVLQAYANLEYVHFDFEDVATFDGAFADVDRVFLLRPPHISDIDKYFKPLMAALQKHQIHELVFLSVQGAEKSQVIPHNKIERLIREAGFDYIFLRPSYFMQNLTTTLLGDIQTKRAIILPAGKAKFNWIDLQNIGEVAAILLHRFHEFKNQAYVLTGHENENFEKVTSMINAAIENPVQYRDVNPLRFYKLKKKDGMVGGMIIVMILLHFLPRFQQEPEIADFYERLTGKKPTDLKTFIEREKTKFQIPG